MAILTRVKISTQQRYDLEDLLAAQAAIRAETKLWTKAHNSELNLILSGFTVSGVGLNSATINMANAALMIPQNSFDFSYFVSAPAEPDVVISDAQLVDGARNYLEVELTTQGSTPLTKAFWDPEADSGAGSEFNQIVDTIIDLGCNFVVTTGGFSGSPNRLPIAIIDVDGSGAIKMILDRRELFGRLAKPNNLDNEYAWGTKVDPVFSLVMTSVTGTFVAGETITIGGETAKVVNGGTSSITFNEPTGINFGNASSVVGGTSGATGTVNTVMESFLGVDKNLSNEKKRFDALATEIKKVKKTRFWWQDAPTLIGLKDEVMSTIAGVSGGARLRWDGSRLAITDDSLTPAVADNIAAIRVLSSTASLNLRRQDDGKEVVTITTPESPDEGTLTLDQGGNSIAIDWDDATADIQSAWNSSGAFAATITGSLAARKIVITANSAGLQTDVTQTSNTLEKSGVTVVPVIAIKQGMAADTTIAIADGQVLYVDLLEPIASQNYSGVGVGATNYKLAPRGSAALSDRTYWLAYREGSNLIWRTIGELQAGETSQISDNVPQGLLDAIGLSTETSLPSYTSNIRGVTEESLVKRASVLTDAMGDAQEDRSAFLRSATEVTWSGTALSFGSNIVLEIVNSKQGSPTLHNVLVAASPISLVDGESAWVLIDRTLASETLTVRKTSVDPIPAQVQATKNVVVLFSRRDAGGDAYLHIPLHKQVLSPGQTVRLGASGTGGNAPTVQTMAIDNTQTGSFADVTGLIVDPTSYDGFTAQLVVRGASVSGGGSTWASDGSVNADFVTNSGTGINSSGSVRAFVKLPDESIIMVGTFTAYNGVTVNNIVKVSQKGVIDSVFQSNLSSGPNDTISNISRQADGKLLVCGVFTQWNGFVRGHVARLNADGTLDTSFLSAGNAGFNGNVNAVKQAANGDIICVGAFTTFTDETSTVRAAQRMFALNTNGNYLSPSPVFTLASGGFNTAVSDVVVDDVNSAYFAIINNVGGNSYGGTSLGGNIAKIGFSGTLLISTFATPSPWSNVQAVRAVLDGAGGLVIAGRWVDTSNSNAAVFIWRYDSSGVADLTFSPTSEIGSSGFGNDIRIDSQGRFVIAGSFATNNPRYMRRYLNTGANDTTFDGLLGTGANGAFALNACEVGQDDIIYFGGVGGAFTAVNGVTFGSGVVLLGTETVIPPVSAEHFASVPLFGVKKANSTDWELAQGAGAGVSTGLDFEMDPVTGQVRYKVINPLPGTPSFYTLKHLIKDLM